jgi:hypothetical protein
MQRKSRVVIYVCSAVRDTGYKDNVLLSKMIEANTIEEAVNIFDKEYDTKPDVVFGPFYKKKTSTLNKDFDIKFKFGEKRIGIFNGWYITAMLLLNPPDSVFVLYGDRVDGKKIDKPKSIVIKLNEKGLELK